MANTIQSVWGHRSHSKTVYYTKCINVRSGGNYVQIAIINWKVRLTHLFAVSNKIPSDNTFESTFDVHDSLLPTRWYGIVFPFERQQSV